MIVFGGKKILIADTIQQLNKTQIFINLIAIITIVIMSTNIEQDEIKLYYPKRVIEENVNHHNRITRCDDGPGMIQSVLPVVAMINFDHKETIQWLSL